MGVLARTIAVALAIAGCYAPSVRDCTVSCAAPGECANGQVCGSDGWCAAPEVAGGCAPSTNDAGTDARPTDAARDAPDTAVALRVQIMGKGSVIVDGIGACSSKAPQNGDCAFSIAAGVPQVARAVAIEIDEPFAMWMSSTCAGQGDRCVFTPTAATSIQARFAHVRLQGDGAF